MRSHSYSRFSPELGDAVDLQALLDQLADFLLQSGFAGGPMEHPFWGETGENADRSMDALRRAILQALIDSGQFTPEMLDALRGDGDEVDEAALAQMLDAIVRRLMDEGLIRADSPPQMPAGHASVSGPGGLARQAARDVQFQLTERGVDFLGYRALRSLLQGFGKSSFGSHDTPWLATGVESDAWSRPYEFGDTMNLDVNATLVNALARTRSLGGRIDLDYPDLMVRQAEYRSSCATVLMLDTSHSMILYGEDRFTPAKKVALALTHLIRTQFPGDTIRVVLFHDSAEEIPLARLAQAQVGPYHTNTAEGLKLARRLLTAQRKDMRQIVMITDGKPSALTLPDGRLYKNSGWIDPFVYSETIRQVAACRKAGIVINTFMLARDQALVEFVRHVSAIARGRAYFTNTMTLGQYVLMDFLRRRTRRAS